MTKRLPAVRTLSQILPKGAEGGKEFARIVDLLLFYRAQRLSETIVLLDDSAGDYAALDSLGKASLNLGKVGYQYKFYPSPLTSKQRAEVEDSLRRAVAQKEKSGIDRWILVTPDDFTDPANKRDGGDATWFAQVSNGMQSMIAVEHWGHKALQALFIETPALCLFYYPELHSNGVTRRRAIQEVRTRYDSNLNAWYRQIRFVGMSVYKQEATKGVPMEHIYIPLELVAEDSDDSDDGALRLNPLELLRPNANRVILGDPGSGKSTLLRFLALVGQTPSLRKRFKAKSDGRLPVIVTLRRYADELKSRPSLPLIDFIIETTHADFSLKAADSGFFDFYLETGSAILCFDGLDELPNPQFKNTIRDRISGFLSTYPGNTCIVTSRIVGYESYIRFDAKNFVHYKIAHLRLPQIEQFISDWYAAREEAKRERDDNIRDLTSIINNPEHDAIRELARNPLLLTIITLVHRIDAVLPDERVVLYQKCTETLLNTWHTWKFRDTEDFARRKNTDRRNRRRMEAIAYWMQERSVGEGKKERAVVGHDDLAEFLISHIYEQERQRDPERDPEDIAEAFLQFITERAGLLIEVGDGQYSFVHLTFQEYLASSNLKTISEKGGVEALWKNIEGKVALDRWQEVIRLLVASLLAADTRATVIDRLIQLSKEMKAPALISLLLGCLLDSVEEAEVRAQEILQLAVRGSSLLENGDSLRQVLSRLRLIRSKDVRHARVFTDIGLLLSGRDVAQVASALTLIASGVGPRSLPMDPEKKSVSLGYRWIGSLFRSSEFEFDSRMRSRFNVITPLLVRLVRTSREANFVAAALHTLMPSPVPAVSFRLLLSSLHSEVHGPFHDFGRHLLFIYESFLMSWAGKEAGRIENLILISRVGDFKIVTSRTANALLEILRGFNFPMRAALGSQRFWSRHSSAVDDLDRGVLIDSAQAADGEAWGKLLHLQIIREALARILVSGLRLSPSPHWREALQVNVNYLVMDRIASIGKPRVPPGNRHMQGCEVALILFLEIWLGAKSGPTGLVCFESLLKKARSMDDAEVKIVLALRDLVFNANAASEANLRKIAESNAEVRGLLLEGFRPPDSHLDLL